MNDLAVIGDIHGCIRPLNEIVERAFESANHVVFTGDYINRGSDSRAVIEALVGLRARYGSRITLLTGNHDRELLDVLNGESIDTLLRMGGAPTVLNYVSEPFGDVAEQLRESFPASHREFLESLESNFETPEVLVTHESAHADANRYTISGHTVLDALIPRVSESAAMIDTGCGTLRRGRLTCLTWPDLEWFQSREWDRSW